MIQKLIDKKDTSELVRDQVAAILLAETASQQQLALDAGKDPSDWELKIYTERSNPWEAFRAGGKAPIVNVWYSDGSFPEGQGSTSRSQACNGTINVDVYGRGTSQQTAQGHTPGDEEAALNCQRAVRLIRNILMSSEYTYLQMRPIVSKRWPASINFFQPQLDSRPVQHVVGGRVQLSVKFEETAPQYEGKALEIIALDIQRADDGAVYIDAEL